jgi:hypothetical protein
MKSRSGLKAGKTTVPGFARAATAAVIAVGITLGCSDSTGPGHHPKIEPASPTMALESSPQGPRLNTSVTLTNTSSHPLVWSECGVSLEKGGMPALPPGERTWESVWSKICYVLDAGVPATTTSLTSTVSLGGTVLKPGESVTIPIIAVVGQQPFPNFTGEPGLYRFRLTLASVILGNYYPLSPELAVSDPFTIVTETGDTKNGKPQLASRSCFERCRSKTTEAIKADYRPSN